MFPPRQGNVRHIWPDERLFLFDLLLSLWSIEDEQLSTSRAGITSVKCQEMVRMGICRAYGQCATPIEDQRSRKFGERVCSPDMLGTLVQTYLTQLVSWSPSLLRQRYHPTSQVCYAKPSEL